MHPAPSHDPRRRPDDREEWTVLTWDVDLPCVVCHHYLHRGQAVGYVKGQLVHARCYGEEGSPGRQSSAA